MKTNHFIKEVREAYRRLRDVEKVAKELNMSPGMVEIAIED